MDWGLVVLYLILAMLLQTILTMNQEFITNPFEAFVVFFMSLLWPVVFIVWICMLVQLLIKKIIKSLKKHEQ